MYYTTRYIIAFILIFFLYEGINAQTQSEPIKIRRKEFKKSEHGFKEAWKHVKKGNEYYSYGIGSYREAREEYLKAYSYNPDNAELNYLIGRCYLFSDNKFEAIKYIEKAFKLNPKVHYDIHYLLGMAYHQTLDFNKAIEEYNYFINELHPKIRDEYREEIDELVMQCNNGKALVEDPKRVVINNIGVGVNSLFDDYGSYVTDNDSVMYYTSRRKYDKTSRRSLIDDKFYEDIYVSTKVEDKWSRSKRLSPKILGKTNKTNIAMAGFSDDLKTLYIYEGKKKKGDIYISEYKNEKWKSPKKFRKINTKYKETSVTFNSDETEMYYTSGNMKEGFGGMDIYKITKDADGKWSKPANIGGLINTKYDEFSVRLSGNDSILYFSSKGHNSMGGYDVFESKLDENGKWSDPSNVGYPINTPNDDIFFQKIPDSKTAYYSANRESGNGGMDIYEIIFLGSEKELFVDDIKDMIVGVKKPYDNIYFTPVEKLELDTTILMRGFITDSQDDKPIVAKIELIDLDINKVVATSLSDNTGNYSMHIPEAKKYGVEIVAKGYLLYLDNVDLSEKTYGDVVVRNFKLDKVEVGAKVILRNIYFEFGKSTLKPESYASLNNVVKLLENNENLRIEISGHTDNVGSLKSNMKLSTQRAKAVVEYLMEKGIDASRLEYKGYAYTQPIADNKTDEGRAQNRRVEFKILSK